MKNSLFLTMLSAFLLNPSFAQASNTAWSNLKDGYYGTWNFATPRQEGINPLISQCGFKITWMDQSKGSFLAETTSNQTVGGFCNYALIKYQCTDTTCLSSNANPIEILPDGTFVFYSYKFNLPMKYTFYGTQDQSKNLFMAYASVGFLSGGTCSSLSCSEAHAAATDKAIELCHSAGYSTCKEIWFQQIDWISNIFGINARYFATAKGS